VKKKIAVWILLVLCLIPGALWAITVAETSGLKTSSAVIHTGTCYLTAMQVYTDGTNAATIILYDNTAASGTVLAKMIVPASAGYGGRNFTVPVYCGVGIYASISGTNAGVIVEYVEAP
jgi:hypothetical protein